MNLFQLGDFTLHTGQKSLWKIDCDALTKEDWATLARMIYGIVPSFSFIEGVPSGGLALAEALQLYRSSVGELLIVDDVLTTGTSMEELRAGRDAIGVVVFARRPCPPWIKALFQMPA
jgi:orotate phosphoribosyltransferase